MANEYLATYLNDHLAGSLAAIELLEHLETAYAATHLASFFVELRREISADRQELQRLMDRLEVSESRPRKLSAWLTGKLTEIKLRFDDSPCGALRLLESLEVLGLGIHGKLALWRALGAAADSSPALQGFDYEGLAQRAEEQRWRVEVVRLEAAKTAFTNASGVKDRNSSATL
jgi:hypothetical protein